MNENNTLRQAKILFASGQLEKSIVLFDQAERAGADLVDVYLSRGAAEMALGKYKAAGEDFTRVLDYNQEHERAHYYRGVAYVALGRYEDGIKDLTFALIKNNNRGIAHLLRGLAYAEIGHEGDAVLDINSASAFSDAELDSFKKLFGKSGAQFTQTKALLAEENAPWNTMLSKESAATLRKMLC